VVKFSEELTVLDSELLKIWRLMPLDAKQFWVSTVYSEGCMGAEAL